MKKIRNIIGMVLGLALLFGSTHIFAAESSPVLSVRTEESNIFVYVDNPGFEPSVQCQIGTKSCDSVTVSPVSEETVPMKTIFLIDNSLSVKEEYRSEIKEILEELAASRMNGELFSVAVFSTQIEYLLEDSGDYTQIKDTLNSITYQDQETYLTDVLYELLQEQQNGEEGSLKRIIIISDGMDNKVIGYTKEELYDLLGKKICPVYTLGCTYQDNNEELKDMFALSRMTGGESWLLDDVTDPMDVVNGICSINDALMVTITPENEDCDGTTKGLSLVLSDGENTAQYTLEVRLPFAAVEEASEEMTAEMTENPVEMSEMEPAAQPEPVDTEKPDYTPILMIAAVLFFALAILIICIVLIRKKSKQTFKPAPETKIPHERDMDIKEHREERDRKTRYMNTDEKKSDKEKMHNTYYAWRSIKLTDQNDPEKSFQISLGGDPVLVGYNQECQICLNYNEYVSGKHCQIFEKDGTVMVSNLSRTNPTVLNGKKVEQETKVDSGDVLTLGTLNMKVEIYS